MSNSKKDSNNPEAKRPRRLKKEPQTGLWVLSGPSFTKEDVARDFPEDSDRDAIIIRRSVGLPTGLSD